MSPPTGTLPRHPDGAAAPDPRTGELPGAGREASLADDLIVLLDEAGRPRGSADREVIHTGQTPYHLAFSCYLFDENGRLLLTRRSLTKRSWPGTWTNSCCGHPRPGEEPADAVARRVSAELGGTVEDLELVLADFSYRAVDPSGIVEHELCPVWVGRLASPELSPDPAEVMETCWVEWPAVVRLVTDSPQLVSPWAALQVPQRAAALSGRDGAP